jgi:tetratricopeptide (TPR) repeat protein
LTLILTLRADFYPHIAQHQQLREMVSQHQEFIGAMTRDELVSAIDGPLAQGGWKIQEGLIEVILEDVGYEPGALPLLSHALLETWRRRRGRTLTLSGYTESGGIAGAIAKTAETVFRQRLSPEQQPVARMIFLNMAELGEDIQDTRRRATFDELITQSTNELMIETVINILADARLVTTGTIEPGDTKTVELAHEALIREWPTLREWLDQDREGLILHRQLTDATNDWIRLEHDPGVLYRGTRLEHAVGWAEKNPDLLSLLEQEFLDESRKVAKQEADQARRLARATRIQRALALASVLLILVASGLVYNFVIRKVPAQMDGFFNLAVAQFGQNPQTRDTANPPFPNEAEVRNSVFQSLQSALKDNPNVLVWTDGSELQAQHVIIGAIGGAKPEERAQSAQAMAERLHADMILYGNVDDSSGKPRLQVTFWLASDQDYGLDSLQGNFQVGGPVPLTAPLDPAAQAEINKQASATAWIALGLTESRLGHSLESLEAFLKAKEFLPDSDMVQFFIGREYLFLVDREAVLEFAREPFEQQAEVAFRKAIELNPNNARAYTGLGGVYYKQARRLVADNPPVSTQSSGDSPATVQAQGLVEQAIAIYQHALSIKNTGGNYRLLEKQVVALALGNAYLLKGEITGKLGNPGQALELFDQAIRTVQPTLPDFQSAGAKRYLAQAYEYLGSAYQWKGYTLWSQARYTDSLEAYSQSATHFQQCVAQGEGSEDVVIKQEIAGDICTPHLNEVQQLLQELKGDQG